MWMGEVRAKGQTSIAIVASCDGFSLGEYKIAIQRSVGSQDTWMKEVAGSRGGTIFIPHRILKEMFETSGKRVTEANTAIGESDEQS